MGCGLWDVDCGMWTVGTVGNCGVLAVDTSATGGL